MIEAKDLHFSYQDQTGSLLPAIREMSLSIPEGSYVAIIGPNASGKSTLARLLAGILFATSGELKIEGLDPKSPEEREKLRTLVGLIFQNPDNQLVSVTVEREVAFGLENLCLPPDKIKERIDWALGEFDLERYRFHSPNRLSGGEKQRLAIASVMAMQPAYLILDEPTSFLDPTGRAEILSVLDRIGSQPVRRPLAPGKPDPPRGPQEEGNPGSPRKLTTVHITQFPEEACLAEKVLVLNKGKLFLEGSPAEVFSHIESLESIGLRPPQLGRLKQMLKERGLKIMAEPCRAEEFQRFLESLQKKWNGAESRRAIRKGGAKEEASGLRQDKNPDQIVSLEELSFCYHDFASKPEEVLSEVNLSISVRQFVGLVGPTGSGKTTLAHLISGLLKPTSGKVTFPRRKEGGPRLGLILQFPERQFFRETVSEDIGYGLKNLGCSDGELKAELERSLQLVDLEAGAFSGRQVHALSGGEQRRVAIASILAMKPKLLILDEPFIALDPEATVNLKHSLRRIHEGGISILLISHDLEAVFELCSRLIILKQGRIAADLASTDREGWPEAILKSGLILPDHLTLLRDLEGQGWEVNYRDLTLKGTASQIASNLIYPETTRSN
jgi:energy-coupling factor transport system ATP-binding protein